MPSIDIAREHWISELNRFTAMHEGWIVSIDVLATDIGAQPEVDGLPLIGIAADRLEHDGTITVSVARSATEHLTHIVSDVRHLYLDRIEDGSSVALLIEAADGTRTLVRVRAPAHYKGPPQH
jgi:hypothetical protein